jgi:hypothetical protein
MIELLLQLIDRLIDLKKYQAERVEKTFKEILDPVFSDLLLVHGDYVRMFEDVQQQLIAIPNLDNDDGRKRLLEVAETLRQRRLEFEPVRQKLGAMTRELSTDASKLSRTMDSKEAEAFVVSVLEYFPRAELGDQSSRSSALIEALREGAAINPAQVNR